MLGKPLGVVLGSRLAVRTRVADPPVGTAPRQLLGIGTAAGIGFTVALFVTELAFDDPRHRADAKLAILLASVLAATISLLVLASRRLGTIRNPSPL